MPRAASDCKNLKSLHILQEKVMRAVNKEVNLGRVTGPFMHSSLQNLKLSPVGMVPKKGSSVSFNWAFSAELGVPLAEERTLGPSTCLVYLGLEISIILFIC